MGRDISPVGSGRVQQIQIRQGTESRRLLFAQQAVQGLDGDILGKMAGGVPVIGFPESGVVLQQARHLPGPGLAAPVGKGHGGGHGSAKFRVQAEGGGSLQSDFPRGFGQPTVQQTDAGHAADRLVRVADQHGGGVVFHRHAAGQEHRALSGKRVAVQQTLGRRIRPCSDNHLLAVVILGVLHGGFHRRKAHQGHEGEEHGGQGHGAAQQQGASLPLFHPPPSQEPEGFHTGLTSESEVESAATRPSSRVRTRSAPSAMRRSWVTSTSV